MILRKRRGSACRKIARKTQTLQTDKSTHKYTHIISLIIVMHKTSLEIANRQKSMIFFNRRRERDNHNL